MKKWKCISELGCNNQVETEEGVVMIQCFCGYPMKEIEVKQDNEF